MTWHDIQDAWPLITTLIAVVVLLFVWHKRDQMPDPVRRVPCEARPTWEMLACANWLLNHAAPVDVDDFEEFTDRWLRQVTEPEIDALVEAMRGIVSRPNVDMEMRNTVVELLSRWADSHLAAVERKLEPLLSDPVLAGYVREALGLDDEPGAA